MTVQFFRLVIEGTNEVKLKAIKDWFDVRIIANDLSDDVGNAKLTTSISEEPFNEGNFTFQVDMYIKSTVNKSKYRDIIFNQFKALNKTGLTKAYIDTYDDCSHDSDNPQPCVVTRIREWNA